MTLTVLLKTPNIQYIILFKDTNVTFYWNLLRNREKLMKTQFKLNNNLSD